jgi:hypothetical protein
MSQQPATPDTPANTANLSSGEIDRRLVHLWSVRLPIWIDPWAVRLADAFADGAWTARWRKVSAFAPPIAFALGVFFPVLWPWMKDVYTESLLFMMIVVAGAILSGPVGVMLLLGYVLGDLVTILFGSRYGWGADIRVRLFAGHFISYMLLALPTVILPQLGRRMSEQIAALWPTESELRHVLRALLYAVASGLLVFLWCQAMIVLVRPVFTFVHNSPTTEAVVQVQTRWGWLVAVAMLCAAARLLLEEVTRRSGAGTEITELDQERWVNPARRGLFWRKTPLVVRVALAAIVVTLVLSGTYGNMFDAFIVLVTIAALKAWRSGLFGTFPPWWSNATTRIPVLVRFILAPLIGYALAHAIIAAFWSTGSLRPVMLGALLTLVVFQLLFPPARQEKAGAKARSLTTQPQESSP